MRGNAEGTPTVPLGLPYNPTISLSVRTAAPIAEILFSVLLLFLKGLGSQTIRWEREIGRKARMAAAWESERWGRFLNDGLIALFLLALA